MDFISGADYTFTHDQSHHSDSCAAILFEGGPDEMRENVLMDLLSQIAGEACFDELRTKEQLGYSVGARATSYCGVNGQI
jgi:secreted Zn-dependent insulinase-like peptidase